MDFLSLVADVTSASAPIAVVGGDEMPTWVKLIIGPMGALIILAIYAIYTEKYRVPKFNEIITEMKKELFGLQAKCDGLRDKYDGEKDELRARSREREEKLEAKIQEWRDKHTKERTVRSWWQSRAQDALKRLGDEIDIPDDIDKTYFGGD